MSSVLIDQPLGGTCEQNERPMKAVSCPLVKSIVVQFLLNSTPKNA